MDSNNPYDDNNNQNQNLNDDFSNPFQNDFNNNNNQNNFNPYEEDSKGNNNNDKNNKDQNLDNNDDFSNPFQNDFNNNNNNNQNKNYNPFEEDSKDNNNNNNNNNPNINNNDDFSNPFKNDFNNNNQNNNDNQLSNPFEEDFKKDNNNQNNNNNDNEFSNPFKNDFNDNNNNNNNNNKHYFNPYDDDNNNNNNNPFEDNMNSNPFVNNFGHNNFNNNQSNNNNNPNNNNNNYNNNDFNDNNNRNFNQQNNNNNFNNNQNNFNDQNNFKNQNNFNNQNNNNFNRNNAPNNTPNNSNTPSTDNEKDLKKIQAIIGKCQSLLDASKREYEAFNIREAITTLCKTIKGLDSLKQTINTQKQLFSVLLPQITSLRNKSFSNLQEYRIMVYKIINIRFKPVLFRPYDQNETLIDFCSKYILHKPFISFDDIYDNNSVDESKKVRNSLNFYVDQANKTGNKCFLVYGPHGCGKTLTIHALANKLGARIAQIEGIELFKIPFFSRDFIKACFSSINFKPLIIYMKNIEQMFSTMNNFNFIYDKVSSSFQLNVYFFASSSINAYNLPRQINDKFQFFQLINPVDKKKRSEYIRFISEKIGIAIKINEQELNNFAMEKLNNFSNGDIFDLIRNAIGIKKNNGPPDDENWVYREGLYLDDILNALGSVKGTLTNDVIKSYYL